LVVIVQGRPAQGAQLYRRLLQVSTNLHGRSHVPCYWARRLVNSIHESSSKTAKNRRQAPTTPWQVAARARQPTGQSRRVDQHFATDWSTTIESGIGAGL